MSEHPKRRPIWELGCQVCKDGDVVYPDILLCERCYSSPAGHQIREFAMRDIRARASVKSVSGGLPSLGKRR
jgi:hypothetical protein